MADTIVEFFAPSGLSLDVDLFLQSDPDVLVATAGTFEAINAKGYYFAVIPEPVMGRCNAAVRLGAGPIGAFALDMLDDDQIHRPLPTSLIDAVKAKTDRIGTGTASVNNVGISATGDITIYRGDSATIAITVADDLTDADQLWLTAKRHAHQADADALIMVSLADGLIYLDGDDDPDASQTGSLAITDAVAATIELSLSAEATAALPPFSGAVYDIQKRTADGIVRTVGSGAFAISADITHTTGG